MRRPQTSALFACALACGVLGTAVFWWSDNPFAVSFVLGVAFMAIAAAVAAIGAVGGLVRSPHRPLRVMGVLAGAAALGFACIICIGVVDYRVFFYSRVTTDKWSQDLQRLSVLVPRAHPDAFAHVSRAVFDSQIVAEQARIPKQTDAQRIMSLVRIVASLHDGHSTIFPFQPATGFHLFPLQLYVFSDGVYVTDAAPRYRHLVGQRLVQVATSTTSEAIGRLTPYVGADNEVTVADRIQHYLLCAECLAAAGLTTHAGPTAFTFVDRTGQSTTVDVRPDGLVRYFYWFFQPLTPWKRKRAEADLPLYQRKQWDNYWMEYLPEHRAVYVAFNQVRDKRNETFEDFGLRVLAFCRSHDVDRLVIDVRNNSGGDNTIFGSFIDSLRLSPLNRSGKLFVLIGRHTFSAAVNFVSVMESKTHAIFAGEPAGAGPNHFGDPKHYTLAHSKLVVLIASRRQAWGLPGDTRTAHEPQIPISLSSGEFFNRRDPVLAAVLMHSPPITAARSRVVP
jgi:hypothetical protein